ncbi:unnamed protein product, partial [Ectocarpus sp. 8 AP-2014]
PLRVTGIFTDTTISPSSWPRQCPDRCTIRAGRNLPDKEFRYLRTVIVTAAVYWGFNSMLLPEGMTSPLNLPAPGRCQALYVIFRFCRALYGSILPSSLAMNLSSALEYSSQPPVSVYGTGCFTRFSWKSICWIITLAVASVYYRGVTAPFNVQFRLYAPTSRLRHF